MGPALTVTQDLKLKTTRPLPGDLAELALLDIDDVCNAVCMSRSWWHDEVRAGRAPAPLHFGPRCSRWTAAVIRQYLIQRAAQPQAEAAELVKARATKASAAAQAKRMATRAAAIAEGASA